MKVNHIRPEYSDYMPNLPPLCPIMTAFPSKRLILTDDMSLHVLRKRSPKASYMSLNSALKTVADIQDS